MGTWGEGAFDNDTTMDWWAGTRQSDTADPVIDAVRVVAELTDDQYCEDGLAGVAVAAAELVAAAGGRPGRLPEGAEEWVRQHRDELDAPEIRLLAEKAVDRVESNSETAELWADAGKEMWLEAIDGLRLRLQGAE